MVTNAVVIHLFLNEQSDDYVEYAKTHACSTSTSINVNSEELEHVYSLGFSMEDIAKTTITPTDFSNSIRKLFEENLPDDAIFYSIVPHFNPTNNKMDTSARLIDSWISILDAIAQFYWIGSNIGYTRTPSMETFIKAYKAVENGSSLNKVTNTNVEDSDEESDNDADEVWDDDIDEEDNSSEYPSDIESMMTSITKNVGKGKSNKKKKDINPTYPSSRVLKASKDPKKQYHRHGVIIFKDKDTEKKDEKILKAFLKDFIPGDARWKKELRSDLIERWMASYAISQKRIKKLEKNQKLQLSKEKQKECTKKAFEILKGLNRGIQGRNSDVWNNPNK